MPSIVKLSPGLSTDSASISSSVSSLTISDPADTDLPVHIHQDGNEHVQQEENSCHHVGAKEEERNLRRPWHMLSVRMEKLPME